MIDREIETSGCQQRDQIGKCDEGRFESDESEGHESHLSQSQGSRHRAKQPPSQTTMMLAATAEYSTPSINKMRIHNELGRRRTKSFIIVACF